ncbi:MAG: cupin domain-containing protein [Methanomassiliicoccales archaeon]|jgi:quercetin dioxygenase-like cupin family protein|nr:cupin domain-containing protein [Methanomassiliicoccales archaeon]
MKIFRYQEATEFEPIAGVRRRMLACGEKAQIVEYFLPKGTIFPLHMHPHEQTGFVERGVLRVSIGGQEYILGAGDGYYIPPNVEHSTTALEDCINVDVFSPLRDEYKDR